MVLSAAKRKNKKGQRASSCTARTYLFPLVGALAFNLSHAFQSSPHLRSSSAPIGMDRSAFEIAAGRSTSKFPSTTKTTSTHNYRHRNATPLNAFAPAAALSALGSPLGSIGVLAFVILVHEGGHFLAARLLGINVEEFSVGVGPRILGLRRRIVVADAEGGKESVVLEWIDGSSESDEEYDFDAIEFSLRAVPLGGYVRFPENYDRTLAYERDDIARKARDKARAIRIEGANAFEKWAEVAAARSVVVNAITLGFLRRWAGRRFDEQLQRAEDEARLEEEKRSLTKVNNKNTPWWILSWTGGQSKDVRDDKAQENADDSAAGRVELLLSAKEPAVDYYEDPNLLQNRPWQERALVLSGGVIFNILLAFTCYFGEVTTGKGLSTPIFDSGAVISSVSGPESPSFGLLKRGDIIVGINDIETPRNSNRKGVFASQSEISNIISTILETPEGESQRLTIVHGPNAAGAVNTNGEEVVSVTPRPRLDALGQPTGPPSIGVTLVPNYVRTEMVKATSVTDGISKASSALYSITSATANSIVSLLASMLLGKGTPAGTTMSGPIGVIKSGAEVVSSSDVSAIVAFAAAISVNLAVINSLPLPALDGGQLMFVLAEAVAGRRGKVDQRLQEGINAGALFILFFLSVGTAIGDITSLFNT